jgi:hypothetical protein
MCSSRGVISSRSASTISSIGDIVLHIATRHM